MMRKCGRASGLIIGALTAVALWVSVVTARPQESKIESAGVTGVWQGKSTARCAPTSERTRCGAVNDITFTLVQRGSEVTGSYKCAYGNMNCRNMNNTGRISNGKMGQHATHHAGDDAGRLELPLFRTSRGRQHTGRL
jgi:hypothetical protein